MAEIRPFKAFRYHERYDKQISQLVSPLFDVVTGKQRVALYENPLNSIYLSVPLGEKPHQHAQELLNHWKKEDVIVQDDRPCIYVYYQYFYLPNDKKQYCRKGFIAMMRAYDYGDNILLRHENTIPYAVNDRIRLLEHTHMNVSPTHGLYTDSSFELEKFMDEAMKTPLYQIEDYQGVTDAFSKIDDPNLIEHFVEKLAGKQVILADGHHRYESSLQYRQKMQAENKKHTGEEGYNYHMIWLTNTEAKDLRILPTHRLVNDNSSFPREQLLEKISQYFYVQAVGNAFDVSEVILGKKWTFGLVLQDESYKLTFKQQCLSELNWAFPKIVKEVDLTILHYFFIEKVLGIKGKNQRENQQIAFERNYTACISQVMAGAAKMALITNEIPIEQIKQVCYSGYTLPQKSTYFYPKTICGFAFGSIAEADFS